MPSLNHNHGGFTLEDLRRAAVLSQAELAGKADLCVPAISELETGKIAHPRSSTVRALAGALGVTPQEVAAALAESRRRAVQVSHGA